jgi:hypothetical protein
MFYIRVEKLHAQAFLTPDKILILNERLVYRLSIREIPGSNLGPETSYPDRLIPVFLSSSMQIPE